MSRPMTVPDWIDLIFKFVIGFFVGVFIAHVAELASIAGWWFAVGLAVVLMLILGAILVMDRWFERGMSSLFDKIGLGGGIKPARNPKPPAKRQWFIRFGWMFGLIIGALAVFFLPEGVLDWII